MLNIQNLLFALKTISAVLGSCVIFFEFWFLFWFYLCHFLCFLSSSFCSIPLLPCLCLSVSSLVFLVYTSCFYCGKNFSLCLLYFNLLLLFWFYDLFLLSISLCMYTVLSFSFVGLEFPCFLCSFCELWFISLFEIKDMLLVVQPDYSHY